MFRPLSILFAAGVALFGATAAHAGTHWSVGINLPVPGVIIGGNGGGYYRDAEPVYYEQAPSVRYAPIPVYGAPSYEPRREWYGDRGGRWERHREWERARFERSRDGRDGRGERWNRGDDRRGNDHRRDDGDGRRGHRD
ncbi:MAG TPA: hypothetical protein VNU71_22225 [Burkholderiaceae bacterium]|nr:hypothetical protein [Burkholderiaceae bacterium]